LSPFYLFQVFSVTLWCIELYFYYAGVIFLASFISIIVTLKEMRDNYRKMREMSAYQSEEAVFRGAGEHISIVDNALRLQEGIKLFRSMVSSVDLVPGDLIEVRDNWTLPCDCILLNGSCIVNESMLTGESIPIVKTPLAYNDTVYNSLEDGK
jgi:cation-transporting ATPase 13A3/4/5